MKLPRVIQERLPGSPSANGDEVVVIEGESASELRARRDALAQRVAEMQWDLGGLVYEMAIRDHFRLEVVVRRAAELQALDAELGETERLLRMEEAGAAGACRSCGALHSRGALFCWHCGETLLPYGHEPPPRGVAADASEGSSEPDPAAA